MSQFTTPFRGELVGKNLWKTIEPFEYHVGCYPSDEIIKVPVDFETDFATIPRIFWALISPIDKHAKAAVVHDYCYATRLYKRKKCDLIYEEGLKVLRVTNWKVWCMYHSVRWFGWIVWYWKIFKEWYTKKGGAK